MLHGHLSDGLKTQPCTQNNFYETLVNVRRMQVAPEFDPHVRHILSW